MLNNLDAITIESKYLPINKRLLILSGELFLIKDLDDLRNYIHLNSEEAIENAINHLRDEMIQDSIKKFNDYAKSAILTINAKLNE